MTLTNTEADSTTISRCPQQRLRAAGHGLQPVMWRLEPRRNIILIARQRRELGIFRLTTMRSGAACRRSQDPCCGAAVSVSVFMFCRKHLVAVMAGTSPRIDKALRSAAGPIMLRGRCARHECDRVPRFPRGRRYPMIALVHLPVGARRGSGRQRDGLCSNLPSTHIVLSQQAFSSKREISWVRVWGRFSL